MFSIPCIENTLHITDPGQVTEKRFIAVNYCLFILFSFVLEVHMVILKDYS